MNAIPRLARDYAGPALLSYGFRPFFLLGALHAAIAVLVWLPVFYGELSASSAFAPRDWHVHELLYGYLPAIITGFLLTAIPNWTGRLPLQGKPLLVLVVTWLAGTRRNHLLRDLRALSPLLLSTAPSSSLSQRRPRARSSREVTGAISRCSFRSPSLAQAMFFFTSRHMSAERQILPSASAKPPFSSSL